ncbi:MAG TPA: proline--tRNA ligase [Pseudonocardiaceae bacterium]|nr:proline--tRNA ligase [Pseudonocardiaceae bacterium]
MSKPTLLTPQRTDFPRWYQDVIARAELADNGPVRGTMVIRPTGYALWERMQREVDDRIKAVGGQNAYFPLFIPESYLKREAEHVEGFSPELAVVTHAGGKQLDEPVVVRPTSETIINSFFAKWVQSYRDLPLKLNNWSNVVRWEMRPRVFLRTTEFLWQEGHTCHATEAEARAHAREVLDDVYGTFMTDVLAIPIVKGRKTARERFAGAINTLTCEAMMADGKALQMGTSHELGQNFARAFGVQFLAASGQREYVWQTSWGVSTRMVGGLIMCHGDDAGLRLPPRLAPVQVIVLVVRDDADVRAHAHQLVRELRDAGVRAVLDEQTDISFGRRAIDAELKGIPVRIELGPRELTEGKAVLVRRIPGTKEPAALAALVPDVKAALRTDQQTLHDQALARRDAASPLVESVDQARDAAAHGWARIPWSVLGEQGETTLIEHAVTVRCLTRPDGSVPDRDDEPDLIAWVGRAY